MNYGAIRDSFMRERRTVTRGGVARLEREQELINESITGDAANEKKRQRMIKSQRGDKGT